jgi:hypothetical protein
MKIKIFCRCSFFPSWSRYGLTSTPVVYEPLSPFRGYSCRPSTYFPRSSEQKLTCSFIQPNIFFSKFLIPSSFHIHPLFHPTRVYFFHHTRYPQVSPFSVTANSSHPADAQQWSIKTYLRWSCLVSTLMCYTRHPLPYSMTCFNAASTSS